MSVTQPTDQYFAGLFDGEGCVTIHLAKANSVNLVVQVSMCDREPVVAMHHRFGGRFVDGKHQTKSGRNVYVWNVYNAEAVEALELFSEQCLVKKVVAQAALPVARSMLNNRTRGVLTQEEKKARIEAAQVIAAINKPVGARRVLDPESVAKYMEPKRLGGGKRVRLSDGREFDSLSDAAKALGVTVSSVSLAKCNGTKTAGVLVEAI